jgi:hypothetical protein
MEKIRFILLLCAICCASELFGQCCGAGNPISASNIDQNLSKKHLQIMLDYRHSESDRYYEGSGISDFDFPGKLRDAKYDFLNLGIGYGITKFLTVQAQIGYYLRKSEDFENEMFPDARASGIGDLALSVSHSVYRNAQKGIDLTPFVMAKFPVGKFDCENQGVKLPISMQPSSGSYKYAGGLSFYSNLSKRWYLTFYGLYEYAQRIKSNNFDYQYGGLTYLNVAAFYELPKFFSFGGKLGYEYQSRARSGNEVLFGTVYHMLKFTPQILCKISRQWRVSCSADIPMWRYVEEVQMSNKWAINAKIMYDISLIKR